MGRTDALPNGTSYHRAGHGPPIVLIHGIGSRWQVFEPIIDALAAEHEVLALDLPGFGATPAVAGVASTVDGYAAWVAQLLDELGITRPHVVGSSMGGGIAMELGRRGVAGQVTAFAPVGYWTGPGRVWCQSVVTTMRVVGRALRPVITPAAQIAAGRAALFGPFFGRPWQVSPEAAVGDLDGLIGATRFTEARKGFATYDLTRHPRPAGGLADIPVTVAWGTRDAVLLPRQAEVARALLPQARHVTLRGCGHLPFSDDPSLCADVVLAPAEAFASPALPSPAPTSTTRFDDGDVA
ncbi:alpha/beta hydrolase [Rhodococcus sp. X156]|uniref:alpha/beta fold hydrolase n=1 Tax=Rhodococcus sp. X156 TaxID=2499145 RepID=UPI000FDBAB25|nr:alpha/beta hydrolase [Rhodococcus sp. X156]